MTTVDELYDAILDWWVLRDRLLQMAYSYKMEALAEQIMKEKREVLLAIKDAC